MGALLRSVRRDDIHRGQVIITPGSMKAVKKFQAQIHVCLKYTLRKRMFLCSLPSRSFLKMVSKSLANTVLDLYSERFNLALG